MNRSWIWIIYCRKKRLQVSYPFNSENAIIQSMKMGLKDEAIRELGRFVES